MVGGQLLLRRPAIPVLAPGLAGVDRGPPAPGRPRPGGPDAAGPWNRHQRGPSGPSRARGHAVPVRASAGLGAGPERGLAPAWNPLVLELRGLLPFAGLSADPAPDRRDRPGGDRAV